MTTTRSEVQRKSLAQMTMYGWRSVADLAKAVAISKNASRCGTSLGMISGSEVMTNGARVQYQSSQFKFETLKPDS